jgi:hypothetical protein
MLGVDKLRIPGLPQRRGVLFGAIGEDGGAAGGGLVGPFERGASGRARGLERGEGPMAVCLPGRLCLDLVKVFL